MNKGLIRSECENCKHVMICKQTENYCKLFNELVNIIQSSKVDTNINLWCEHFEKNINEKNIKR